MTRSVDRDLTGDLLAEQPGLLEQVAAIQPHLERVSTMRTTLSAEAAAMLFQGFQTMVG